MQFTSVKNALITASFLAVAGHANLASAHAVAQTLGRAAGATDVWKITCYQEQGGLPTFRLATHIQDLSAQGSPRLSVQTFKGSKASNTTDPVTGNAGFSPWTDNNGGNGIYYAIVDSVGAGVKKYRLETHCEAKNDSHTGEGEPKLIQDQ